MNQIVHNYRRIQLGNNITKKRIEKDHLFLPISYLRSHTLISGFYTIGGSHLLARIANQLYDSNPAIGVLNINQLNPHRKNRYLYDRIYDFKARSIKVPYFIEGKDRVQSITQTAEYISASMGLGDKIKVIMREFMLEEGVPKRLSTLLFELLEYIKRKDYQVGREIILLHTYSTFFKSEEGIDECLELSSEPIDWFEAWKSGAKLFLDFCHFTEPSLRVVLNAIYQLIRTLMPVDVSNEPKGIIMVEQAGYKAFSKSNFMINDKVYPQLGYFYRDILEDFSYRGISFIWEEDQPQHLFPCILKMARLKIFFRLWYPQNIIFSLSEQDIEIIENLPNYNALIINETTKEKYRFTL